MGQVISIIDDDPDVLHSLAMLLRDEGYEVAEYGSAAQFLGAPFMPGCVLTDLDLPGTSGIELIRALKRERDPRPVIAMTGRGNSAIAVQVTMAGALACLDKPLDHEALRQWIDKALAA